MEIVSMSFVTLLISMAVGEIPSACIRVYRDLKSHRSRFFLLTDVCRGRYSPAIFRLPTRILYFHASRIHGRNTSFVNKPYSTHFECKNLCDARKELFRNIGTYKVRTQR